MDIKQKYLKYKKKYLKLKKTISSMKYGGSSVVTNQNTNDGLTIKFKIVVIKHKDGTEDIYKITNIRLETQNLSDAQLIENYKKTMHFIAKEGENPNNIQLPMSSAFHMKPEFLKGSIDYIDIVILENFEQEEKIGICYGISWKEHMYANWHSNFKFSENYELKYIEIDKEEEGKGLGTKLTSEFLTMSKNNNIKEGYIEFSPQHEDDRINRFNYGCKMYLKSIINSGLIPYFYKKVFNIKSKQLILKKFIITEDNINNVCQNLYNDYVKAKIYLFKLEDDTQLFIDTENEITSFNIENKTFQYKSTNYNFKDYRIDSKYITPPPSYRMGETAVEGFIIFWEQV